MPNSQTSLPFNSALPHPNLVFSPDETEKDKAKKLKEFLIGLSKQPEVVEYRSIIRQCADAVREKAFGISEKRVESRLSEAFQEYFDGENYRFVEMCDLEDLTALSEKILAPVLDKLIKKGIVETSQRRRWNEPGKHYNLLYRLKK